MKQSDLRATLGAVRANEEQIARVMRTVAARAEREEARRSMSRLGFGMRIAAAACAFIFVLGLGIYVFNVGGFDDPAVHGVQRTNEEHTVVSNTERETNEDEASRALTALLAESKNIDGDWAILEGSTFYFAGGEEKDGVTTCTIAVSVENLLKTSDGSVTCEDEITAEILFSSGEELNEFTNAISSSITLLIEKNDDSHDAAWTVRKIIY